MKLDARKNPEEASNVKLVFCNDKRIGMPVALDTEEGWVDAYVMEIPDSAKLSKDNGSAILEVEGESNYELKRFHGVVTVIMWSDSDEKKKFEELYED